MNKLRELMVDKKVAFYLVAVVAFGVFGLVLSRGSPDTQDQEHMLNTPTAPSAHTQSYHVPHAFQQERALEARLEDFFSLVEGAGQVRVMISPLAGHETVFAVDVSESSSHSKEQDAQGGTREQQQHQSQQQTVIITDRQGTDRALVLREIYPQVQGIVIIAEGGESPFVRDALTRAAMAMLGLDAHTIQVLTMAG